MRIYVSTPVKQEHRVVGGGVVNSLLESDESGVSAFSIEKRHVDMKNTEKSIGLVFFPCDISMSSP